MRVFVLGDEGMLGRYVYNYLKLKSFDVIGFNRSNFNIENPQDYLIYYTNSVVINCIGLIPQRTEGKSKRDIIIANTTLPHNLQDLCKRTNSKLIHITTDCVFSGLRGFYSEASTHDCLDIYGKSKSLGEPEDSTIIRTSIIGEEIRNKKSLLEFVKANKDREINGYINHYWNGITCLQFAKICEDIIQNNLFWKGVKHIYSSKDINKFTLIKLISDVYNLNVCVKAHQTNIPCHRTLISIRKDINFLIPNLEDQILKQKNFGEMTFEHI